MRVGLLHLSSGISGDMFLGALVDAGAPLDAMRAAIQAVGGKRLDLRATEVIRAGLRGVKVDVLVDGAASEGRTREDGHHHHHHHRPHREIEALLERAPLDAGVREDARRVFARLAEVEGRLHGMAPEDVEFHEVGSWDAIADIVGTAAGLRALGLERLYHGPVALGGGTVRAGHGLLPLPAPATLDLLAGRDCVFEEGAGELATPTGAALIAVLAEPATPSGSLRPERIGHGAGTMDPAHRPNLARLILGEMPAAGGALARVAVVETSLDDCTPEDAGHLAQLLLEGGALDATLTPTLMKKGRPGFLLRLIGRPEDAEALAGRVLCESSSLGVRWRIEERLELPRRVDVVELPDGRVRVKVALLPGGGERPHVEYEDLADLARRRGGAIAELRREVERRWREGR